jgi:serine phosphatase RsbU (regulator of sigma subunit)
MTPDGEEFGDLRLYGSVVAHLDHQLDDLLDGLLGLVQGWSQREDAEDDLTVLAIRVKDEDD